MCRYVHRQCKATGDASDHRCAETLVSIDRAIDELPKGTALTATPSGRVLADVPGRIVTGDDTPGSWGTICFYITPIGAPDSDQRKHSDLFLSSLVQPALAELGLTV